MERIVSTPSPAEPEHTASPLTPERRRDIRRVMIGAPIGTMLEWFDFGLYGSLSAIVFPTVFFPTLNPAAGTLAALASFGVGLAMRPLGALLFSHVGDRMGRKRSMVIAIILMGAASLGMGLLPGYAVWGIWAPVALVLLRCIQGLSLGGESTAAQLMAMEYAPRDRRAFFGSLVNVGAPLGLGLVSVVLVVIRGVVGEQAFIDWAWRLPFLIGFVMAVVGFIIRRYVNETPVFVEAQQRNGQVRHPIVSLFKLYPGRVFRLTFLWVANVAASYVVNTYSAAYITQNLHMSSQTVFTLVLIATLFGVIATPLGGYLADRVGRKPILFIGTAITFVGVIVYFPLLNTGSWPIMALTMILTLNGQGLAFGALGAVLAEQFPTQIRYSGHAVSYTLINLVGGSATPFIAAWLIGSTGTTWSFVALLVVAFIVSFIMIARTPETRGVSFTTTSIDEAPQAG